MIRHLTILLLLFIGPVVKSQYFNELYDIAKGGDLCSDVFEFDSVFFMTGAAVLANGQHEFITITTDKEGRLNSKKRYSFGDTVFVRSGQSIKISNGKIADVRTLQEYDAIVGNYRTWPMLSVFSQVGDTIWTKQFIDTSIFWMGAQSIIQTSDSGFVLVCDKKVSASNRNPVLIRTDKNGNELFRKEINTTGIDVVYSVLEHPNKDIYLSGGGNGNGSIWGDPFMLRVDEYFNKSFFKYYPKGGGAAAILTLLRDSNILLVGDTGISSSSSRYRSWKVNPSGSVVWDKSYSSVKESALNRKSVELKSGELLILGGYFEGSAAVRTLSKLTPEGDTIWMNQYYYESPNDQNYLWDFIATSDGGFLLAGDVFPQSSATQDLWLLKVDSNGCNNPACDSRVYDIRLGIDYRPQINTEFNIYPNPVVNELNVVQQTEDETKWQYQLLNLNGQIMQNGEMVQSKTLNVGGLPNGSYVLQLQHGPVKKSYQVVK